jgi:regulator of RNase E activity RraA
MSGELTEADLAALTEWDTPTICNALEIVAPERRAYGFNRRPLVAPFPEMKPVVGYARTAGIRAREPYGRGKEEGRAKRLAYYDYIAKGGPRPSLTVIQDLDGPDIGFGAFWGEVQTHVHQALGSIGTVTDGCVRDLDAMAKGFFVLAGSVMPSHAHVELVDFGGTVSIHGMIVRHNDLIHADRHGAVVIPHAVAKQVPEAARLLARREKVLLDAAKRPGFSVEDIRKALAEADEIH